MIKRVIHGLHELTENYGKSEEKTLAFTVPDLCFALPLISAVVNEDRAKKLGLKEDTGVEALHILCKVLELCVGSHEKSPYEINGIDENDSVLEEMDEVRIY